MCNKFIITKLGKVYFFAALILFIDWRYGRRWCYSHILERKDYIHCEDEDQRKRRIERGNIID